MIKPQIYTLSHKVIISIRNYWSIVWQNANKNPVMFQIVQDGVSYTYFLNSFWAVILALCWGAIWGIIIGLLVSVLILVYHWMVFQFGFKSIFSNARWKDYINYRENRDNRKHLIKTRGGAISMDDVLNAIDDSSNGINPIVQFLKNQCFRRPGFYRVKPLKWNHVIHRLNKLGLVKWIIVGGTKIGIVSLDSFLLQILNFSSLSFQLPLVGTVSFSIFEVSKVKLVFNILGLATVVGVGSVFLSFFCVYLIALTCGLINLAAFSAEQASIWAVNLIASMTVYVLGQFAPANCSNLAEYLADANLVNGKIRIRRSDFQLGDNENGIIVYSRPPITGIEFVDNPVDFPVADLSIFKDRHFADYSPRTRVKEWKDLYEQIDKILDDMEMEDLDFISPSPIYERVKEEVAKFVEEGGGLN